MTTSKIAILVPVHNKLSYTKKCLINLYGVFSKMGEDSEMFSIIVINDGSTDGTKEWILSNYPATVILEGDGHLWWSGGINRGIEHAVNVLGCEYILWWNNDIYCSGDYFNNLLKIIANNPTDTIIGSKIYFTEDPEKIWAMGGVFEPRTGNKFTIGMNETDSESYAQTTDADWLPGMGTLIHKTVFTKIGLVDEKDFPQYHGDSDFTFRAKLAGYRIIVYPELKIWNDKSNSGLLHYNSLRIMLKSLHDVKSNYHLGKDILFYRRYASSPLAYKTLFLKYYFYIGGFLKWKILNILGIKKSNQAN